VVGTSDGIRTRINERRLVHVEIALSESASYWLVTAVTNFTRDYDCV
jgi:hypothetical protein